MDIYEIVDTLAKLPATFVTCLSVTAMIHFKRPWLFAVLSPLAMAALMLVGRALGIDVVVWEILLYSAMLLCMSDDKWAFRLFVWALSFVVMFMTEILGDMLFLLFGGAIPATGPENLRANPGMYFMTALLLLLLTGILFYMVAVIWNRVVKTGSMNLLLFVLFPISQMALGWYAVSMTLQAAGTARDYWFLSGLALLSVAADVVMLWVIQRLRAADEARLRADFWEQQLSRQQTYYDQMVQKAEETSRIRHDLRNQLQAVCFLFREGSSGEANRLLDELESSLSAGQTYCENRVVNAVLTEKAAACRTAGVRLESDVALGREPGIGERDLCSLFANLLDNALAGSRASGAAEPYIRISGAVNEGALAVRCRNSAKAPEKKSARRDPLAEHGWGLTILEELAARYGGSLETAYANGEYDARAILPGPEKTA